MSRRKVWIINPYGSLPTESWATYRSTMLAESLVENGYDVVQYISNFEHRSKTFRSDGFQTLTINVNYIIQVIPSNKYSSHISMERVQYERTFGKNLLKTVDPANYPDFIVLAEPSLFYYDVLLKPLILKSKAKLVLDIIDIWPELFVIALPKNLRPLSKLLLAPLYYWRRRLYQYPNAVVAVAKNYLDIAKKIVKKEGVFFEVVYWSYHGSNIPPATCANTALNDLVSGKKAEEIWIVYAGTLGENYDIHSIIDVAKQFAANNIDQINPKFIIAGDGPLKEFCKENEASNLVFLGRISAEELKYLYQFCDVALSTYKGDSTVAMPIKAFDYVTFGLPVVNSLERDLGEFVEKYQIGINYHPGLENSLFESLKLLVVNDQLRKSYSQNARILGLEFQSSIQYKKFATILGNLK